MEIKVSPSLLAANILSLGDEVRKIEAAGADLLHIDVIDGVYRPNIACSLGVVPALRKFTSLPLDVHMMTVRPGIFIETLAKSGADIMTVHTDAGRISEVTAMLDAIRASGMKAGLATNPDETYEAVLPFLGHFDMALVMTVNPGFGGQKFIDMSEKIAAIRRAADGKYDIDIEVDGGITPETAKVVKAAGANILVAGTAVFKADDPKAAIAALKA